MHNSNAAAYTLILFGAAGLLFLLLHTLGWFCDKVLRAKQRAQNEALAKAQLQRTFDQEYEAAREHWVDLPTPKPSYSARYATLIACSACADWHPAGECPFESGMGIIRAGSSSGSAKRQ
jgi:hypothetical protein